MLNDRGSQKSTVQGYILTQRALIWISSIIASFICCLATCLVLLGVAYFLSGEDDETDNSEPSAAASQAEAKEQDEITNSRIRARIKPSPGYQRMEEILRESAVLSRAQEKFGLPEDVHWHEVVSSEVSDFHGGRLGWNVRGTVEFERPAARNCGNGPTGKGVFRGARLGRNVGLRQHCNRSRVEGVSRSNEIGCTIKRQFDPSRGTAAGEFWRIPRL